MAQKPVYQFTKDGYQKLQEELQKLIEKRPGVVIRLSAAREQGDLSENAGYHAAKDELGWTDSRIRELKHLIRFAQISDGGSKEEVTFGSRIKVNDGQRDIEFTIVSAMEARPIQNKISDSSPIGSALIGKKVGEKVEIETPSGKITFNITEIR